MANSEIFMKSAGGGFAVPLPQAEYVNEGELQDLIAISPQVIAGRDTQGSTAVLELVKQEMSVPDAVGQTGLRLDHLFVDDQAVPVMVEVKRHSDTRSRRLVVAQLLDYAANGYRTWTRDSIRETHAMQERFKGSTTDADLAIKEKFGRL